MALSFVQAAVGTQQNSNVASFSVTFASNITTGNHVIVRVFADGAVSSISSVTDPANTYTALQNDGTLNVDYYKLNAVGGNNTITVNSASGTPFSFVQVEAHELTGDPVSIDKFAMTVQTGTSAPTSASVVPSSANEYVWGGATMTGGAGTGGNVTAGGSFTLENTSGNVIAGGTGWMYDEYLVQGAAASIAASFALSGTATVHSTTSIITLIPNYYGYELVSPPLVSRERRRVAAMLAGSIMPPMPPPAVSPRRYGYDLAPPLLLSRERRRVAAMVATGGFLPSMPPPSVLPPRYGYELTSPAILKRPRGEVDLPVPLGRQNTDVWQAIAAQISPPYLVRARPNLADGIYNPADVFIPPVPPPPTWTPDAPMVPLRTSGKMDVSQTLSRQDTDQPPQYGYEQAPQPLTRVRRKPDLPVPPVRQDTDAATRYGYDLVHLPLIRSRRKPDLPAPLSRQDADLAPVFGGFDLTSPPLLTRRRTPVDLPVPLGRLDADVATGYGYDLAPQVFVRIRTRADLTALLSRLDSVSTLPPPAGLLVGFDFAQYVQTPSRWARYAAALAGASLAPPKPSDLLPPVLGYELVSPPLTRARRRPADITAMLGRLDTDRPPLFGFDLIPPTIVPVRRQSPPTVFLGRLDQPPLIPPALLLTGFDFAPQAFVRARRRAADVTVTLGRLDTDRPPLRGIDLVPPTPVRVRRKADVSQFLWRIDQPPPPIIIPVVAGYDLTSAAVLRPTRVGRAGAFLWQQDWYFPGPIPIPPIPPIPAPDGRWIFLTPIRLVRNEPMLLPFVGEIGFTVIVYEPELRPDSHIVFVKPSGKVFETNPILNFRSLVPFLPFEPQICYRFASGEVDEPGVWQVYVKDSIHSSLPFPMLVTVV